MAGIVAYTLALQGYNNQVEIRNSTSSWIAYKAGVERFKGLFAANLMYSRKAFIPVLIDDNSKLSRIIVKAFAHMKHFTILRLNCIANESTVVVRNFQRVTTTPATLCQGRFQVAVTNIDPQSYYLGDVQVIADGSARICAWAEGGVQELITQAARVRALYEAVKAEPDYWNYRQAKERLKQAADELIRSNNDFRLLLTDTHGRQKVDKWINGRD